MVGGSGSVGWLVVCGVGCGCFCWGLFLVCGFCFGCCCWWCFRFCVVVGLGFLCLGVVGVVCAVVVQGGMVANVLSDVLGCCRCGFVCLVWGWGCGVGVWWVWFSLVWVVVCLVVGCSAAFS
ncbi:hypothetical protein [Pseudomonas syringae group genomosp. 7]|uniref:hypothetical protein n=1 Tax=Pseudomonas syringae group genomosp. 7 TaxID=251699 RepID=UPI00376FDEB8